MAAHSQRDSELRQRLEHRGCNPLVAYLLVRRRDDMAEQIGKWLAR